MRTYKKRLAYPEKWICQQYREAARKPEAVRILAELNAVGPDAIRNILKSNGIDVSESIGKPRWAERVLYREINTGQVGHASDAAKALGIDKWQFVNYMERHDVFAQGGQVWKRVSER